LGITRLPCQLYCIIVHRMQSYTLLTVTADALVSTGTLTAVQGADFVAIWIAQIGEEGPMPESRAARERLALRLSNIIKRDLYRQTNFMAAWLFERGQADGGQSRFTKFRPQTFRVLRLAT